MLKSILRIIVCVLAGGFMAAASAQVSTFTAALSGANEVPSGDPDGSGNATVSINTATNTVSWSISAQNIDLPPSLAHIHRGAAGVNGPVVIDFSAQLTGSTAITPALATEIIGNPGGFYVNVHTTPFPGGAIRGQLAAQVIPPTGQTSGIPTLSEWALITLALALGVFAMWRMRSR